MKKIVLLSFMLLALSCSKKADFSKVKKGIAETELINLVGDPVEKQEIPFIGWIYIYETHVVSIRKGKVMRCDTKENFAKEFENASQTSPDIQEIDAKIKEYKEKRAH